MAFFAGKNGSISVNGATQPLTDWSIDGKVDAIETTNFASGGAQKNEAGIAACDISASGPYDGTAGAQPGTLVTFVLSTGTGPSFTVAARLTSVKVDLNVKDVAKVNYTATSSGSFSVSF